MYQPKWFLCCRIVTKPRMSKKGSIQLSCRPFGTTLQKWISVSNEDSMIQAKCHSGPERCGGTHIKRGRCWAIYMEGLATWTEHCQAMTSLTVRSVWTHEPLLTDELVECLSSASRHLNSSYEAEGFAYLARPKPSSGAGTPGYMHGYPPILSPVGITRSGTSSSILMAIWPPPTPKRWFAGHSSLISIHAGWHGRRK